MMSKGRHRALPTADEALRQPPARAWGIALAGLAFVVIGGLGAIVDDAAGATSGQAPGTTSDESGR